jgi:hypothetical protein
MTDWEKAKFCLQYNIDYDEYDKEMRDYLDDLDEEATVALYKFRHGIDGPETVF